MEPSISALGAGVVGGILKPVISDLYARAKSRFQPSADAKVAKNLENFEIGDHVYKTINVKTLWNVEREVSLFEFYYPSCIEFPGCPKFKVNSFVDIPSGRRYVIQGTAGQGKSIFLRFLYGTICFEAEKIKKIPVFIELRKLSAKLTIRHHIVSSLKQLGLDVTLDDLDDYLSTESLVLLLDAFDEIDNSVVNSALIEIEELCNQHAHLPVIISARPDSGIQNVALFRVARLQPLEPDDLLPFLKRVCQDLPQANQVHSAIKAVDGSGIESLLTTPLLVTLLVWLYRAQSTIPSTLTKFYDQLFDVMFYKHDQTKPGFKRLRYTSLDDSALKTLFEGFCFQAKIAGIKSFDSSKFAELCRETVDVVGIAVSPGGLKSELVKTACLLVEDGIEISFIHRSVSEFYAARFVRNSSDEFAKSFYFQVQEDKVNREWRGELNFLGQIDSYRFSKYFLLEQASTSLKALGYAAKPSDVRSSEFWRSNTRRVYIDFVKRDDGYSLNALKGPTYPDRMSWFADEIVWAVLDEFVRLVSSKDFLAKNADLYVDMKGGNIRRVGFGKCAYKFKELKEKVLLRLEELVGSIVRARDEALGVVAREEGKSRLVLKMKARNNE